MPTMLRIFAFIIALTALAQAKLPTTLVASAAPATSAIDLETGLLWQVGHNTPIDYLLAPTQLVWRSGSVLHWDFDSGALVVRNRLALQGTAIIEGPETAYFALAGAPSLEWWDASGAWSAALAVGGGAGLIDSQDVVGGQGRDFTLNWFARAGVSRQIAEGVHLNAGLMFQHMSNGGATDPNPGIDVLGFTLGCSWSF
jgi:hypothetical protein